MRIGVYMVVLCAGSWVLASWLLPSLGTDILLGMVVPMSVASSSAMVVERACRRDRVGLTGLMVKALFLKLALYPVYVALVILLNAARPVPFAISFTVYFLSLHALGALHLRDLFRDTLEKPA